MTVSPNRGVGHVDVVVACTATKTAPPADVLDGPGGRSVEEWVEATAAATPTREVGDLYAGASWAAARSLQEQDVDVVLHVASAGHGLLALDDRVPSYDATFVPGGDASVAHGNATAAQHRTWWTGLCAARGSSLTALAKAGDGPLIVVLSAPYLEAVHDDLVAAAAGAERPLMVVSATAVPDLEHATVLVDQLVLRRTWAEPGATDDPRPSLPVVRWEQLLPGGHATLGYVVVRHLLGELGAAIDVEAARRVVAELRDGLEDAYTSWSRRPFSDDAELDAWIAANREHGGSYTSLLRHLRSTGRACEQTRFRDAYRRVADEVPPTEGQLSLADVEVMA